MTFCGCYHIVPSHQTSASSLFGVPSPQRQYLPLVSSSFHSTILSNTSRTVLTQKFTNPSKDTSIQECIYTFPLYADVSVVKFTCRIGKKVLYGIVKEKFEAKTIFDEAVAKGETAGLLEQSLEASDVFSTKLGNVPPGESVFVEVTYIGELKNGDGDSVRFTIPTSIAPRYGSAPSQPHLVRSLFGSLSSTSESALADSEAGIKIVVDINIPDGSFIKGVQSPSHPISVSIGTLSTATEADPTMSKASATLALGSAALEKDFVLIVQSKNSGIPKALLETHPTLPKQRALMATLVPKFTLPPSRPELVFVADRSGSMGGNIPMLISALKVFLKSMPAGVKFNICSFGSSHQFLWPKSRTYDAGTLKEASDHIETFAANFGGTETFGAIKATIERRWADLKLDIILLTDGDIWGQDQMLHYLTEQTEATNGKIRVFPLGIGNGVSHALIEGIARAGNGFAQAVQNGERLDAAVVKMLRGALTPHITDYSLEVKYAQEDDDFEIIDKVTDGMKVLLVDPEPVIPKQTISLFDNNAEPEKADMESTDPKLPEIPTPKLLQAPHKIPSLFAFSRTTAYILLSPETFHHNPTSVIFRATSEHGPLELEIPVESLAQPGKTIHQLAAKKATQDMEEGRGWIYEATDQNGQLVKDRYPSSFDDLVKKECVRLGEKFQVAGKWCSFVAVEANQQSRSRKPPSNQDLKKQSTFSDPDLGDTDVLQEFDFDSFLHQDGDADSFTAAQPAAAQGTSNFDNELLTNTQANATGNHALQDYQMQLMLLEQQNKKRHMMARQNQDNMQQHGTPTIGLQQQQAMQQQQQPLRQQQQVQSPQSHSMQSHGFQNQGVQQQQQAMQHQQQMMQQQAAQRQAMQQVQSSSMQSHGFQNQGAQQGGGGFFSNTTTTAFGSSRPSQATCFSAPAPSHMSVSQNNNPSGPPSVTQAQSGTLFGGIMQGSSSGVGLNPPSTGSLFGSSQALAPGFGCFGSTSTQAPTNSGGLFAAQGAPAGSSLFGNSAQQQMLPSSTSFGGISNSLSVQSSAHQGRSLFGGPPPPPARRLRKGLSLPSPTSPSPEVEKIDWKTATNEQKIHALIELQSFDGAWPTENESEILEILDIEARGHPEGIDGTIWITLVVVGVLERKMADEEGTWALVVEKAKTWLSERESASPSEMKTARESLKI